MLQVIDQAEALEERFTPEQIKVAQYLSPNSPFFEFYTGVPSLNSVLRIQDIAGVEPVDFSEALRAYRNTTGWDHSRMADHGDIKGTTLLPHIINRSGPSREGKRLYADTRFPPTTSMTLIKLGKLRPNEGEVKKGADDKMIEVNEGGRISIAFYDAITGHLVLRSKYGPLDGGHKDEIVRVQAQTYLQEPTLDQSGDKKLEYLSGILTDRFDTFVRLGIKPNIEGTEFTRNKFELKEKSKLAISLKRAANALSLLPIYLINPPDPKEVQDSGSRIAQHIEESQEALKELIEEQKAKEEQSKLESKVEKVLA